MLLLDFNPLVSSRLADGGPQYFETNLHRVIAEPWNAFSSLAFLIPVALFLWKLKGHYRENIFLIFVCAPLLAIGGIGSTLFHALRSSPFFLMLDVFPIALLTLSLSLWFCYKLIPKWYFLLIFFIFFAGIRSVSFYFMHGQAAINLSYFLSGLMIFVPGLFYLFRTKFLTVRWLILSILLFFHCPDFPLYRRFSPAVIADGRSLALAYFMCSGCPFSWKICNPVSRK